MPTLSSVLINRGMPGVQEQLAHPTVAAIARGDIDPGVFRAWVEQDYLFLLDYVRVFSRLAWRAPDEHLGDLIDLAYATWHDELSLHRGLADEVGADLEHATKGPVCVAYTSFLLESAADYGRGLAALFPCMWGYSTLGRTLALDPPADPLCARWIATYADPAFAVLTDRCAQMLDEAHDAGLVDEIMATATFDEAMAHELAFWGVSGAVRSV